jgi:NhaA family Na+:H+ antiporter
VRALIRPVERFLATESASGILLILTAALAFAWANSPWADAYTAFQQLEIGLAAGGWQIEETFAHWVNDGLMAIFFFLVGLEIKREVLAGELKGIQRAALPVAGAVGGMVIPALIYVGLAWGTPALAGWGVPMATDIAFAVGVLALLGPRVPLSLKVFLLALAIVDDLGAVLVIALFYTDDLDQTALVISLAVWGLALAYGRSGRCRPWGFVLLGIPMWFFMLQSGVHATVAGVLLALAVPMVHGVGPAELKEALAEEIGGTDFESREVRLGHLEAVIERARSPLHDFEHRLAPLVAFGIMPVFALVNAGVPLAGASGEALLGTAGVGVLLGLLLGKPIGIAALVALAVACRLATLPPGVGWGGIVGVGLLGGIGFTMAIFIANLAFGEGAMLDQAKLGILAGSVVAAAAGYAILVASLPKIPTPG